MKRISLLSSVIALCGFATASMAQTPAYIPTNGLTGWWPFNGNASDVSGSGNNGTVSGAALTSDRNGNGSSAYVFNGTSDYISCNIASLPVGSAPRTISTWMQTTSGPISTNIDPTVITIAAYGVSSAGDVIFGQFVRASVGKGYFESGSAQNQLYSATTINDGNWHHVVLTYGGPGSRVRMYIDGVKEDSTAVLTLATGSSVFDIGRSPWTNTFYQGKIDDVGLWDRELTQDEIMKLYTGCSLITATSAPNQTVALGSSAQFIVITSNTVSAYQWQTDLGVGYQNLSNVSQYSGVNTATLNVASVAMTNNNQPFRCVITSGGCTFTSTPAVLTVSNNITGIDVFSGKKLLQAHPNPTDGNMILTVDAALLGSHYCIYDQLGELVLKGELKNEDQLIQLHDLSPGVYFAVTGNSKQVFKILKNAE